MPGTVMKLVALPSDITETKMSTGQHLEKLHKTNEVIYMDPCPKCLLQDWSIQSALNFRCWDAVSRNTNWTRCFSRSMAEKTARCSSI